MDRVILGKTPDKESSSANTYHRAGNTGLFISKPGANVMSCSDGDLLFDTTANGLFQLLMKGTAIIEKAVSKTESKETAVYTGLKSQYADDAPLFVSWKVILPSTNLHAVAYKSSWNNSMNESFVAVSIPFVNLDFSDLGPPQKTGFVPGASLTSRITANTDNYPATANTIDIFFKNGSPNYDHRIQWSLFRENGIE